MSLFKCGNLSRLLPRPTCKLPDEVFVGIAQHIQLRILQMKINLIQMKQHLRNQLILSRFRPPQLRTRQIQILKQIVEIIFTRRPHGTLLNIAQNLGQILQDKVIPTLLVTIPPLRHLTKQLRRLQKIS